jgi:hypothetical protein
MINLITILISLLGYGSPADYSDYSEAQLNTEINQAQNQEPMDESPDGRGGDWDIP